jgi:hypothetical protein
MAAADANVLANEGTVPQSSGSSAAINADEPSPTPVEDHSDLQREEL